MRQVLSLRDRLKRTDSRRTLVARNAFTARKALHEIADIPRPTYRLVDAICFGAFIDFLIVIRCAPGAGVLARFSRIRAGAPGDARRGGPLERWRAARAWPMADDVDCTPCCNKSKDCECHKHHT